MVLCGQRVSREVDVGLPDGTRVTLPIAELEVRAGLPCAAVKKDAGDDPDVTDGCLVVATVTWSQSGEFTLRGGDGVGTVTKPGLQVPPGEPAINPVPRRMIRDAVLEVTDRPVEVTISIPGGEALADKTFNPRLGVQGGLSILGTSGIVRPFSSSALRDALKCALNVAMACGVHEPVFVPGRIGERAVRRLFQVAPEQVIEVSNEWGFMLDQAVGCDFRELLVLGHPGKLAKLAMGEWDTHSSRSRSAVPEVARMAEEKWGRPVPEVRTVEGLFAGLVEQERRDLGKELAVRIREAVLSRVHNKFDVAVVLVNISGALLGQDGDTSAWEEKSLPSA